jgi:subfamily B ATP-binding cassette protein MsbA
MDARPQNPYRFVFSFVKPLWRLLIALVILYLLQAAFTAIQPLIVAPIIDVVLGQGSLLGDVLAPTGGGINLNNINELIRGWLGLGSMDPWSIVIMLASIYAGISVLLAATEFASFYVGTQVRIRTFRRIQHNLFDHLLSLSLNFFNHQRTGTIMSRFENDALYAVEGLVESLKTLVTAPVLILFYGYMLINTNLRLTVLVTVAAVVQWLIARGLRGLVRRRLKDQFNMFAETNAYLQEVFTNIRVVKSFVAEKYESSRFGANVKKLLPVHFRFSVSKHMHEPLGIAVNGFANATILLLAARELLNHNLTVTGFALFLYLGRAILSPITQLVQVYVGFQAMGASSERLIEMFNYKPLVTDGPQTITGFDKQIRFENVHFAYDTKPILKGVSFEVNKGEITALVGPSGAGKSTLIELVLRFYDPNSGRVTIDGVDLKQLNLTAYRRLYGAVAQENLLFNATVADNISYGRELGAQQIEHAAKVANAYEFIHALPDGMQTFIGDRGVLLSGGQRQRIALARAVAAEPRVLVLDEATSSLDTESERLVQDAIDAVIKDTTAIIIAHRLSTVINADKIIVMDQGKILDMGRHDELIVRCELYKRLCELQFDANFSTLSEKR